MNIIFCSGSANPLSLSASDRRFVVLNNPVPHLIKKRSATSQLRVTATLQRIQQLQPVKRYSLGFPPAGNPSPDVALGCGVSNLVNSTAC